MSEAGVRSVIIEDLVAIGEEMGFDRGLERGLERGLREAALSLCEVLGIVLDAERRASLDALDGPGLERFVAHLRVHRRLPA